MVSPFGEVFVMKRRFLAVMLVVMVAVTYMPKGMGFAESVQARSSDKPKKTEATKEKSEQKFNKTKKASDKLPGSNLIKNRAALVRVDAEKLNNVKKYKKKLKNRVRRGEGEGTAPGMDANVSFGSSELKKRIPYDDESCYLISFVYPTFPEEIFFWSKSLGRQKKLT